MAYQVGWSPKALRELESIAEYIASDSSKYAAAVVQRINAVAYSLQHFPVRGRRVPERQDESLREVFVYSYRIVYRVTGDKVEIIAVLHGRRSLS